MATVEERVIKVVTATTGRDDAEITAATKFVDDLGLDSMDVVELIISMEEEFSESNLEISDDDAQKFATVGDAVNYLKENGIKDS